MQVVEALELLRGQSADPAHFWFPISGCRAWTATLLVEAGLALRPDLKILLMTGYAREPPRQMIETREVQILAQALQSGAALRHRGGDDRPGLFLVPQ